MKKDKFYLQGKDLEVDTFHTNNQIKFEWNMLYNCNYRCPHCFFQGKWDEYEKRTVFLSVEEWIKKWEQIYKKYGRCAIGITGGEPFIYPNFIELIEKISRMHYPINISSNSSGDLNAFVNKIDPQRVSVTLSFQPGFVELDDVLKRVKLLREHKFEISYINLCVYPPYIKRLDEYIEKASRSGEMLKLIPYCGTYNNINYPDGYNEQEKKKLGINESWNDNVKRKGKLCKAGMETALIFPDGKVARCGQIGERYLLGNILQDDFKLLAKPMECDVDYCPCLESDLA